MSFIHCLKIASDVLGLNPYEEHLSLTMLYIHYTFNLTYNISCYDSKGSTIYLFGSGQITSENIV